MDQPGSMSVEVATKTAGRIAEHVLTHKVNSIALILHGGEPLLVGPKRLNKILQTFSSILNPITDVVFTIQTNGLLLSPEILEVLAEFKVEVGISLDGGRDDNDRHRQHKNGKGSYEEVKERLYAMKALGYGDLFLGILATIDLKNDPITTYQELRSFEPPSIDFLLPHGNWSSPPPHKITNSSAAPYADWLLKIFDLWYRSEKTEPSIRIFDEIIRMQFGYPSDFESLGLAPISLVTIQTDGSYELVDTMKSTFDGAATTGANIFNQTLDELLKNPRVVERQIGELALNHQCAACDIRTTCGAGYLPHRYEASSGFMNPSVYCSDLLKLIKEIQQTLHQTGQLAS